jgi:hypothetical protein
MPCGTSGALRGDHDLMITLSAFGQPFRSSDALALGVSLKMLRGSRFRRLAKGVYVAAATADSHRIRVRGMLLTLPPGTIATGVTGLQLLGIDVGPELPMIFASTHPRQVRRRECEGYESPRAAGAS